MLDLLLVASLGFLGSFGHCAGMCGPITVAFSLSWKPREAELTQRQQFKFHLLLNLGRIASYTAVGAAIGALGSVLVAGGQMAGVGSQFRYGMTLFTGILLIWFGLSQVAPKLLPRLPFLHPLATGQLHDRLSRIMMQLSLQSNRFTPLLLGMVWGLIPCGFLYTAQIKAAETGNFWRGAVTLLAFGLGTLPTMLGVGVSAAMVSADRRSQLFRMGGWVTLAIGVLTLLRTGDTMTDYTGHAALFCLILALAARPLSRLWGFPLHYRRVLGVGAFVLSLLHIAHMAEHSWGWNVRAIFFMPLQYQWGIWAGGLALLLMAPAALTSFDWAQRQLGKAWRQIHLLAVPALVLCAVHSVLTGSHYLGNLQRTGANITCTVLLGLIVLMVLLLRWRWLWRLPALVKFYAPPSHLK